MNYYPRAGTSSWLDDFSGWLSQVTGGGAYTLGQWSQAASVAGMSLEAFRAALNTIATNANAPAWQVDAARDELAWLNNGGGAGYFPHQESNTALYIALAVGAYLLLKD